MEIAREGRDAVTYGTPGSELYGSPGSELYGAPGSELYGAPGSELYEGHGGVAVIRMGRWWHGRSRRW